MFGALTVEETLMYAARLKMHPKTTSAKRAQRVNKVIKLLGLEVCRNVVVGSPFIVGISGGQASKWKRFLLFVSKTMPCSASDCLWASSC